MKKRILILPTLAVLCLPLLTFAHSNATGVVKERMDILKSWKQGMKQLGPMAKGKLPLDSDWVAEFARQLRTESTQLKGLFPEGSDQNPSEALPTVWSERDKFEGLFDQLADNAEALLGAAESESFDEVVQATGALGKTCKSCHDDFKED